MKRYCTRCNGLVEVEDAWKLPRVCPHCGVASAGYSSVPLSLGGHSLSLTGVVTPIERT